ncbi:MAG: hypothetical protein ACPG5U_04860 [Planktomarina sp.]
MQNARIHRTATIVIVIGIALAALMIGQQTYFLWSVLIVDPSALARIYGLVDQTQIIPVTTRITYACVTTAPVVAGLAALWFGSSLMQHFRRSEYFKHSTTISMARCGQGLVALGVISTLARMIVIPLVTQHNPAGQRSISVLMNTHDVGFLLAGLLLWTTGWVMSEAIRIEAENKEFI